MITRFILPMDALVDYVDHIIHGATLRAIARRRGVSASTIQRRVSRVETKADSLCWAAILQKLSYGRAPHGPQPDPAEFLHLLCGYRDPADLSGELAELFSDIKTRASAGCSPQVGLSIVARCGEIIARPPVPLILGAVALGWLSARNSDGGPVDKLTLTSRTPHSGGSQNPEQLRERLGILRTRGLITERNKSTALDVAISAVEDAPAIGKRLADLLPPRAAKVTTLFLIEGFALEDIEATLELPRRSAKTLLADALDMIARERLVA